ncbi:MAG: ABC transporter substrate-binding protein [Desulfobacteraceae bacterium]|nr:ABC transporter substrate-binding protein [Desulfobacteraceae bacterium]
MKKLLLILIIISSHSTALCFERIIPMAPNLVETVYALGKGGLVCGVPMFTVYPEDALQKPVVGGFLNPSFEEILKLSPDLVIVQGEFDSLKKFSKKYGIEILRVNMDSLESIYSGILLIGEKLSCEKEAVSLTERIRLKLKTEKNIKLKKVFLCLGRLNDSTRQISTAGSKSFLSEILFLCGGINIFSDIEKNYLVVSKEEILKRRPEIIIDILPGEDISSEKDQKIKNMWKSLFPRKYIKEENIHVLTNERLLIPGPGIVETAEIFKRTIRAENE